MCEERSDELRRNFHVTLTPNADTSVRDDSIAVSNAATPLPIAPLVAE